METLADFLEAAPDHALRLGTAALCGLLLGLEREYRDKPAGLRTIFLITLGAALLMDLSTLMPDLSRGAPSEITRVDPSRIASYVVAGIGFLGAGTIIQSRSSIHGLTTAAIVWLAAAVGMCAGAGLPLLALAVTLLALVLLAMLAPLRAWVSGLGRRQELVVLAPDDELILRRIEHLLESHEAARSAISSEPSADGHLRLRITYHTSGSAAYRLIEALSEIDGVRGLAMGDASAHEER